MFPTWVHYRVAVIFAYISLLRRLVGQSRRLLASWPRRFCRGSPAWRGMAARGTRIAVVSVCVSLAVAGTLAVLLRLPPTPSRAPGSAAAPGAPTVSQAELEVLLGRVARSLDPSLRSKLAGAVLSESARAGYDPLFILGLVSVE